MVPVLALALAVGPSQSAAAPSASPSPAAISSSASVVEAAVCGGEEPIVTLAYSEGPMGPRNVLVAVWDDGRILRSLDEKNAARGYATARLSPFVMEEVRSTLLRIRFWKWEQPAVDRDRRIQETLACADGRRGVFVHKGAPSVISGPGQLRQYLFGLRLPAPSRAEPPIPDVWTSWFQRLGTAAPKAR